MTDKELNKRADNKRLALVLARYLGLIVLVVSLLDVVMVYWKMPGRGGVARPPGEWRRLSFSFLSGTEGSAGKTSNGI